MNSNSRRRRRTAPAKQIAAGKEEPAGVTVVPYDEHFLERARTQWQFGDWESLIRIERGTLQHHPDRAKLALLTAAGHYQTGNPSEAMQYIRLARDWGCSKTLILQILAAGVHNSLGRAAAIVGERPRAMQHFHNSVLVGAPGSEAKLLAIARNNLQYHQLGLFADLLVGAGSPAPVLLEHESL